MAIDVRDKIKHVRERGGLINCSSSRNFHSERAALICEYDDVIVSVLYFI